MSDRATARTTYPFGCGWPTWARPRRCDIVDGRPWWGDARSHALIGALVIGRPAATGSSSRDMEAIGNRATGTQPEVAPNHERRESAKSP